MSKKRWSPEQILAFIILFILAVLFLIPLLWVYLTAFKDENELLRAGGFMVLPQTWTLNNFRIVLDPGNATAPLVRWFMNSTVVSVIFTFISVNITAMSAYAFTKLKFKGRDGLFLTILFLSSFPSIVTIVPLYNIMRVIGWINTPWALIFPGLAGVFNIFLIKQFMLGISDSLIEAASIDGAGDIRTFYQIILPMLTPILAVIGIFSFTFIWNDFLWPSIAISRLEDLTLTAGLQLARGTYQQFMTRLSAVAVLAISPMIIVYFIFEKWLLRGVSISAGVKG